MQSRETVDDRFFRLRRRRLRGRRRGEGEPERG
jgi:hypothetical protein